MRRRGMGLLAIALLIGSSAIAQDNTAPVADGPVIDATLDSIRGGQRSLHDERGRRIIVLFYEDRPHVEDNEAIKGTLNQFIANNHLENRVVVLGVANLGNLGNDAPRDLVRRMIRPLLDRWNVDILLDWDGVMRRPPISFVTDAANVAVVNTDGRIVWRHAGVMGREQSSAMYRVLRGLLRAAPAASAENH
jgi:hypothetical protein